MNAARRERKVVTVLFADLVGFTSRAESLDPEDVEAILRPYHQRLRDELERHGGTVEKFIGDAVMALFGAPVAHEDDPERAVRAALAIREWAEEAGDLEVRIGITTGEALVSLDARPEAGEGMASGDVVNTAARLQAAAPTNGILVDETTYRATERAISFEDAEPVEAKGKAEPVPVFRVVERRALYGVDVQHGAATPLVGRQDELEALAAALARARKERRPQLVTLVGVPGIGKSRLVLELFRMVDEDLELITWRQGRSLPYGEGMAFWGLAEMVKGQAGILETDSAEEAGAKLRAATQDLIEEAGEGRWVETHLRPLVGIAGEADLEGKGQAEAFAAWTALPRSTRGARAARAGLRGSALGRRWPPRLRRLPHRLGGRGSAPRRLHRPARAARAAAWMGWRKGERAHDLALGAHGRGDGEARPCAARTGRPPGRASDQAARACGRQPSVRRGVRPDGRGARFV